MNKKKNKKMKVVFTDSFIKSAEKLFSNNLYYLIPRKLSDWKYEIKWAYQRVFRGYDDTTVWNFHHHIAEQFPRILRDLKENGFGCPSQFYDSKKKDNECHKWKEVLEKMAKGFDAAKKIDSNEYMKEVKLKKPKKDVFGEDSYIDYKFDKKHYNSLHKEFKEGVDLFKKHFFNLWD